jgi:hypothetical protein
MTGQNREAHHICVQRYEPGLRCINLSTGTRDRIGDRCGQAPVPQAWTRSKYRLGLCLALAEFDLSALEHHCLQLMHNRGFQSK